MRAVIVQQEAHGHALDGDEVMAHRTLDHALQWVAHDTVGNARGGHGSFCTGAYLELQRAAGSCLDDHSGPSSSSSRCCPRYLLCTAATMVLRAAASPRPTQTVASPNQQPNADGKPRPSHEAPVRCGPERWFRSAVDSSPVTGTSRPSRHSSTNSAHPHEPDHHRGRRDAPRDRAVRPRLGLDQPQPAGEAVVVLGPWLAALDSGRPRVIWAYEARPEGPRALSDDVTAIAGLRYGVDAVLLSGGRIEEGTAGVYGQGAFALPDHVCSTDPEETLSSLHADGVRSLLIHGGHILAEPFAERRLIDEVSLLFPASTPSRAPDTRLADTGALLPPDFRIAVRPLGAGALIRSDKR